LKPVEKGVRQWGGGVVDGARKKRGRAVVMEMKRGTNPDRARSKWSSQIGKGRSSSNARKRAKRRGGPERSSFRGRTSYHVWHWGGGGLEGGPNQAEESMGRKRKVSKGAVG